MKSKAWIIALVCMLLCMAILPTALAEGQIDTWDGTADTSWYDAQSSEFHITTAEQLAGVTELVQVSTVKNFKDKTLILETDVDLAGWEWTPISTFKGFFNGNGHRIINMCVNVQKRGGSSGLFGLLYDATVENLIIEKADVKFGNQLTYQGILAGRTMDSIIKNCGVSGDLISNSSPYIGGLIGSGRGKTKLQNCWSLAKIEVACTADTDGAMVGGLVGEWEGPGEIIDSYFAGTIDAASNDSCVAGILGAGFDDDGVVQISGCVSYGTVTVSSTAPGYNFHIAALEENVQVENCMWPDNHQDGVARLIIEWDENTGTVIMDSTFDEKLCGSAVADFSDPAIIQKLNQHSSTSGLWALGINGYPVFSSQTYLIRGDYVEVEKAKNKVPGDLSLYTDDTVSVLKELLDGIDMNMSMDEQDKIDALVQDIGEAIAALKYKEADYTKVDAAIAKAQTLSPGDYADFSKVEAAIAAVVRG
ncbi:MAG: hypothetical protein Q4F18_14255, partial [Clostridia bacterium]|nr:hypothetical protein [Clostridia bacterium]